MEQKSQAQHKKVQQISKYFHSELEKLRIKHPHIIKEIRGRGLLIGLKLFKDQKKFIEELMRNKMLAIRGAENVVRLLPPLTVKKKEIDLAVTILKKVCKTCK